MKSHVSVRKGQTFVVRVRKIGPPVLVFYMHKRCHQYSSELMIVYEVAGAM